MKIANRKNRNRLISAAIVVIFIVLAMTPLVPEAEVSSCLVVTALGIDSEAGVIKLTAETSDGTATESVHGEGIRVTDAMQDLNERYGRKIELKHCGVIVMGGEMSADDISFALMSLLSEAAINAGCAVVFSSAQAGEFIQKAVKLTKASGSGVTSYIGFADTSSSVFIPTALNVMSELRSKSAATALPVFEIVESDAATGSQNAQNSGSDGGGTSSGSSEEMTELKSPYRARAVGSTAFELSESETLGLMLFSKRANGGLINTEWEYNGESRIIQGEISSKSTDIKVRYEGGRVIAELKAEAVIRFVDRFIVIEQGNGENVINKLAATLEEAFTRTLSGYVRDIAEVTRREDVLGLRTKLYRSSPQDYKAIPPDLASAGFDISVSVKVS